jgi:hypothetical protein
MGPCHYRLSAARNVMAITKMRFSPRLASAIACANTPAFAAATIPWLADIFAVVGATPDEPRSARRARPKTEPTGLLRGMSGPWCCSDSTQF